jgi:hypothetical protein
LLVIPSQKRNCHGQHCHGGVFFTKSKKEATIQQSTKIKLHRLIAIIFILRLVPRYCWLVVVLGQNERCHDRSDAQLFCFCCMTLDRRVRKRFWNDLQARFWQKGAPMLDLEKNQGATFLHEYIKLEGQSWCNALSSISLVHCASQNSNGYCLAHLKIAPRFHFLKMTFMPALHGETTR